MKLVEFILIKHKLLIMLSIVFISLTCTSIPMNNGSSGKNTSSDIKDTFQNRLDNALNKYHLLGLQVSIRTADNVNWNGCSGHLDIEREILLSNNKILRIGSITKIFVATIILKLVEEKKINLNDAIDKWFPDIPNSESITLRMLLNQTSGIENYWKSGISLMQTLFGKKWKPTELVEKISDIEPYSAPGVSFYYSNSNYTLLAFLIERITQKQINDILKYYIYNENALMDTHFLPQDKIPENLIVGYDDDYIPWPGYYELEPENVSWVSFAYGAGAMVSNTQDLVTFIDSLFYGSILSEKTLREMQTYNPEIQTTNDAIPGQVSYGLGIARFEVKGDILWGHMGGMMGFESVVLHCKEKNYSIAVTGNFSICKVINIVGEFHDLL